MVKNISRRNCNLHSYLSADSLSSLPSPNLPIKNAKIKSKLEATRASSASFSDQFHSNDASPVSGSWSLQPSSQGSISSGSSEEKLSISPRSSITWDSCRNKTKPSGAPDLVMDLPVSSLSSSPKDQKTSDEVVASHRCEIHKSDSLSSSSSLSPDMLAMTATECFATPNQSTLKKVPVVNKALGTLSTDAETQTASVKDSSESESESPPLPKESESGVLSATVESPSVVTTVKTPRSSTDDLHVEVRAASDLICSPDISAIPSTPKLAARYLQAVAASGGGTGVALKPQVRVKPKKPIFSSAQSEKVPPP